MKKKITLVDEGQDLLYLIVDIDGTVVDAGPFHSKLYVGGEIPIEEPDLFYVGGELPIHNPPHIEFGFLKYKIQSIKEVIKPLNKIKNVFNRILHSITKSKW